MSHPTPPSIAVIGISCWYPGARNPRQLWENILARRRQFRQIPEKRLPLADYFHPDRTEPEKTYGKRAAVIDGFEFDWAGRRVPFSTFKSTDMVHWLALEVALEAVADAGFTRESIPSEQTGVIVGNSLTGEITRANTLRLRWPYVKKALRLAAESLRVPDVQLSKIEDALKSYYISSFPETNEDSLAGGLSNTIAGRICNFLSLHGGGYTVDGACSSSLIAVATAATGLMNKDLDLALAGGVDISLDPFELVGFSKAGALAEHDMTVYDRRGAGFMPGEGCGFVVLKRLEDARRDNNYVYAVLKGWGISSDGGGSGITAPIAKGQSKALVRAYSRAGYPPQTLKFIEGHGTGTTVGDRTELSGIVMAMGENGSEPASEPRGLGMTSIKSIIGHTKAASGVAGFIKAVMGVNRRVLPPTAACKEPHSIFDTDAMYLYPIVHGEVLSETDTIRAGVSAMGFGGINCHATVESADPPAQGLEPAISEQALLVSNQDTEIFVLTAESMAQLEKKIENLMALSEGISLAEMVDLAARLGSEADNRANCRCAVVAGEPDDLIDRLLSLAGMVKKDAPAKGEFRQDPTGNVRIGNRVGKHRVGMLFPGQGSQRLNMSRTLIHRFSWAQEMLRRADLVMADLGMPHLSSFIYPPTERSPGAETTEAWFVTLSMTENAQPTICFASILWKRFLNELGVFPSAVGGHSLGELTAFNAAGAFDDDDLLRLAVIRGKAMALPGDKAGTMVSLACDQKTAEKIVEKADGYVVLANINAPRQMVLSGETSAVESAIKIAGRMGIQARLLKVSNAFHCRLASKATQVITDQEFLDKTLPELNTRLFSGVTAGEIESDISIRDHFSGQVLARVNFVSMIEAMARECDIFIETGPGRVLSGLANSITGDIGPVCFPVESVSNRDQDLNIALAALFINGVDIQWQKLYENRLVRPFVRVSDKIFIQNPCERLQAGDKESPAVSKAPALGVLEKILADLVHMPPEDLGKYLNVRGAFLAQIILADLRHSIPGGLPEELLPLVEASAIAMDKKASAEKSETVSKENLETMLLSLVERMTGFPKASLNTSMRLLDDLNLDSIKAGDFVVKAAKEAGVTERIEPVGFANATLAEILDKLYALSSSGGAGGEQKPEPVQISESHVFKILLEQAEEITGYPAETLNADALVEDDLNIGLDKLKKILKRTADALGVDIHVDLDPLRERSLRQIASILARIAKSEPGEDGLGMAEPALSFISEKTETWVREFRQERVESAPAPLPGWWGKRQEDDWGNTRSLILSDPDTADIAEALKAGLFRRGATVTTAAYHEAMREKYVSEPEYSLLIALLPTSSNICTNPAHLQETVKRLACISAPPPAALAPRRRTTVVYVQFSGGTFGKGPQFSHLNYCCATSLAKSLHLERTDLRVRVLDFSPALAAEKVTELAVKEINTPSPFEAVGYDIEQRRFEMKGRLLEPARYTHRNIEWSQKDVILVTGGAKGITAAIALGLARETGVQMALLGTSPHPESRPESASSKTIHETLQKYKDLGLGAAYFSCDVTQPDQVISAVDQIAREMGPVTGVIHGAGLNYPRPANQVEVEDVVREVSPKLSGAMNLIQALADAPPKMFVGIGSVIGVTGMPGNAWYGFSNEAMDQMIRRFNARYPETQTLTVAYSIWRDEGMGARMGSVSKLKSMGIEAIPTSEGVDRFVHLFLNDPGCHQVIVAARMGELATWKIDPMAVPEKLRYLEKQLTATPGVESIFQAHLSLGTDPYLADHLFSGSYLFPTVFGLEAMAQVVAHASGIDNFSGARLRNIRLQRPITVDPETGADIILRAVVRELGKQDSIRTVHAGIIKAETGVTEEYFSADFEFGHPDTPEQFSLQLPEKPLSIVPKWDLYLENFLFQGESFHRIEKVWSIDAKEDDTVGNHALFTARYESMKAYGPIAFPDENHGNFLLGDPFFRDALLQSAYLLVPRETCLPVFIGSLNIHGRPGKTPASVTCRVTLNRIDGAEVEDSVVAVDENGRVFERLEKYQLKSLAHHEDYPTAKDLVSPDDRDTGMIRDRLFQLSETMGLEIPTATLRHMQGLHELSTESRRELELPLMREVAAEAVNDKSVSASNIEIRWPRDGKPEVGGISDKSIGISLSHDDRVCLCISGKGLQGCDIAPVTSRERQDWERLLGEPMGKLLDDLLDAGDTLDIAGTRLWTVKESLFKANGNDLTRMEIKAQSNGGILFRATKERGTLDVLTWPVYLTRGPLRVAALTVILREPTHERIKGGTEPSNIHDLLRDHPATEVIPDSGPRGQTVVVHRFPVTFRPSAQLSRTVYFSNYFSWAGEVREIATLPVLEKLSEQFSTGKFGSVTNFAHLKVLGEATTNDVIETRIWASDNSGPKNSTMLLQYEFRKLLGEGRFERLAWLELQATWVKILDHGYVEADAYPDYYWEFAKRMLPKRDTPDAPQSAPEPLARLQDIPDDEIRYRTPVGPSSGPMLFEHTIETSLEDANLVGNIYFANYYAWQGQTRDRFFFDIIPEFFRGTGQSGELICIETRIDHLREAMPFDPIIVTMSLKELKTFSATFVFEYFRPETDGTRMKLGRGEHRGVWVSRDSKGRPTPEPFPEKIQQAFLSAIEKESAGGQT